MNRKEISFPMFIFTSAIYIGFYYLVRLKGYPTENMNWLYLVLFICSLLTITCGSVNFFLFFLLSHLIVFVEPYEHIKFRIILWILMMLICAFAPGLENYMKGKSREECLMMTHVLWLIASIIGIIKTNGIPRWIYVGICIVSAIGIYKVSQLIEEVKNWDKQDNEDKEIQNKNRKYVNATEFSKATGHTYNEIKNDKGMYGEYITAEYLKNCKDYYKALYSVYIPYEDKATEIDQIIITSSGIYCVEIKNRTLNYRIKDEYEAAMVTDSKGNIKETENPFKQNKNHIKTLKEYLEEYQDDIYGIVVFGPHVLNYSVGNVVQSYCYYKNIGQLIEQLNAQVNYLTKEEIDSIYENLLKLQNNPKLKALQEYNILKKKQQKGEKWN